MVWGPSQAFNPCPCSVLSSFSTFSNHTIAQLPFPPASMPPSMDPLNRLIQVYLNVEEGEVKDKEIKTLYEQIEAESRRNSLHPEDQESSLSDCWDLSWKSWLILYIVLIRDVKAVCEYFALPARPPLLELLSRQDFRHNMEHCNRLNLYSTILVLFLSQDCHKISILSLRGKLSSNGRKKLNWKTRMGS